jgi:hypothetical protein
MAKAKQSRPSDNLIRWRVSLLGPTPARFVDWTLAPDAETAVELVAVAHDISEALRHRLVAIRRIYEGRTADME